VPTRTAYCWGHVDDIARGHLLAMEQGRPGQTYIIAGEPSALVAVLHLAEQLTSIPAPRLRLAPGVLRAAARLAGALETVVPLPPEYRAEYLRVSAGVTYLGDNSKAKRELGYNPRPLREGLEATLRHEMRVLGLG
jgi:nucleoside-diphosphate-sugar epimerase